MNSILSAMVQFTAPVFVGVQADEDGWDATITKVVVVTDPAESSLSIQSANLENPRTRRLVLTRDHPWSFGGWFRIQPFAGLQATAQAEEHRVGPGCTGRPLRRRRPGRVWRVSCRAGRSTGS